MNPPCCSVADLSEEIPRPKISPIQFLNEKKTNHRRGESLTNKSRFKLYGKVIPSRFSLFLLQQEKVHVIGGKNPMKYPRQVLSPTQIQIIRENSIHDYETLRSTGFRYNTSKPYSIYFESDDSNKTMQIPVRNQDSDNSK